jgi:cobalt-zinc-cadmium efflux system outer membrane protein
MRRHGLTIGCTALALLTGFVAAPAQDVTPDLSEPPALLFIPLPSDGRAALSPVVSLRPAPEDTPSPRSLPEALPAVPPSAAPAADDKFRAGLGLPDSAIPTKADTVAIRRAAGLAVSMERLWQIALENQTELREAALRFSEARGRQSQAGKYLNPLLSYEESPLGSRTFPQGDISIAVRQEIMTAGKFRLDKRVAATQSDSASLELHQKEFDILTRIRRGYFDYLTLVEETRVLDVSSKAFEDRVKQARLLFPKTISRTEVISLELLLEEIRLEQIRTRAALQTSWAQLAADVGMPDLPLPVTVVDPPHDMPLWTLDEIEERVGQNSSVRQALIDAETARWQLERARAEAVPNITIGGGYALQNTNRIAGAIVSVDAPLPFWDRKQGRIREAEAAYARLNAAVRSLELRLLGQTREAYGRYLLARESLRQLNEKTLPFLTSRVDLIKKAFKAGAENVNFNDVFQAEQALIKAQAEQFHVRRDLWRAIADLQGLMQVSLAEEWRTAPPAEIAPPPK